MRTCMVSNSLDSGPNFRLYIKPSEQLGLGLIVLGVVLLIYLERRRPLAENSV